MSNLDEVVATGDLFKQARRQLTNWTLRKFLLSGITLTYFDNRGFVKGKIDISECIVRKMSPEECRNQACKFAFGLITIRGVRRCLLCASTEEDREKWISVVESQIREFKDLSRRFMCTNEQVIGTGTVIKKSFLGRESSFNLTITNYPRLLLIESTTSVLKEQVQFSTQSPPTIEAVRIYI